MQHHHSRGRLGFGGPTLAKKKGQRRRRRFGWVFKDESANVWRVRITLPNGKKRQYTAGPTRELADQLLNRLENEMKQAEVLGIEPVTPMRFDEYVPLYLERVEREQEPTTAADKRYRSKRLISMFGHRQIHEITERDCSFLKHQLYKANLKTPSVNRVLSLMSAILRDAITDGHAHRNPMKLVRREKESKREFEHLDWDQQDDLIGKAHPRLGSLVALTFETGLRVGELLRLERDDVVWTQGKYGELHIRKTKNKKAKWVPLTERAATLLREVLSDAPASGRIFPWKDHRGNFRKMWAESMDRAGVRGRFRWHDMRHVYGTQLARAGVPLAEIARLLGVSVKVAARYVDHATNDYRSRAVDKYESLRRREGGS